MRVYEAPELQAYEMDVEDIVTTSGEGITPGEDETELGGGL